MANRSCHQTGLTCSMPWAIWRCRRATSRAPQPLSAHCVFHAGPWWRVRRWLLNRPVKRSRPWPFDSYVPRWARASICWAIGMAEIAASACINAIARAKGLGLFMRTPRNNKAPLNGRAEWWPLAMRQAWQAGKTKPHAMHGVTWVPPVKVARPGRNQNGGDL